MKYKVYCYKKPVSKQQFGDEMGESIKIEIDTSEMIDFDKFSHLFFVPIGPRDKGFFFSDKTLSLKGDFIQGKDINEEIGHFKSLFEHYQEQHLQVSNLNSEMYERIEKLEKEVKYYRSLCELI